MTQERTAYIVIGATASPGADELPQYLDPVCRASDQADTYFVANVAPWDGSEPDLRPIARQTFDEECEAGYWQRLDPGFSFAWDYRLVALDADQPPVYLPASDSYLVVRHRGEVALGAIASELEHGGNGAASDERVWYAARALQGDPFPLLALLALERERLPPEMLADLEAELPVKYPDISPLHRYAQEKHWQALLARIREDPVGERFMASSDGPGSRRTAWLEGRRDVPNFLGRMRATFGLGWALHQPSPSQ